VERGQKALASYRIDGFSEAITEFTKALAFREDDPRLLVHLSRVYAVWAQSLGFRIMDLESSATGGDNTELAALRHERRNYTERAMQYAERAVRHGPGSGESMLALADAARLKGDLDKARSSLAKARSLPPSDSAERLRVEAMMAIDSAGGEFKAGRVLAEKAVEKVPESIAARVLLARCLMAADEREGALSQLELVLSRDPEHPETLSLKKAWESASAAGQVETPETEDTEPSRPEGEGEETSTVQKESKETRGAGASASGLADLIRRGEKLLESGAVGRAEQLFGRALQIKPNEPRALTGMDEVFMVIGGTHLLNTSREQQKKTLEALKAFGVEKIGVSHCTGMKPAVCLSEQLGPERFFFNNAGTRITFPNGKMKVDAFEKYNV